VSEVSASLGNTGNNASASQNYGRSERFAMQSIARSLSPSDNAIQGCLRWPTNAESGRVGVKYRPSTARSFYVGLQTCGQVWVCPVCANKITERRRVLWTNALQPKLADITVDRSGQYEKKIYTRFSLAMATFTVEHTKNYKLTDTLTILNRAYSKLWAGRWAVQYKKLGFVIGTIRALELTYGDNGWHPHIHCVFVMTEGGMRHSEKWFDNVLRQRWGECVDAAGGYASFAHGVSFHLADVSVIEYVNKLGMDTVFFREDKTLIDEVTRYPAKRGRGKSVGIHGLLSLAIDGDNGAARLWQEAQKLLKGHYHIRTSNGLLRTLGAAAELSDDKLAAIERSEPGDKMLALLSASQWKVIRERELRAQLLSVADSGSAKDVNEFLLEVGAIQ
jgi:hypothetical protein